MCYSAEASLVTFAIGITFSGLLMRRGGDDRIVGGFLAFVSLMQGLEYLLWENQLCTAANATLSKTAMALNHLQPLVLGGLALAAGRPAMRVTVGLLMVAYGIAAFAYSARYLENTVLHCTKKEEGDPHLLWQWNDIPGGKAFYALFLAMLVVVPALSFHSRTYGLTVGGLAAGLFAISGILYKRQYIGAMWCLYAALAPAAIWLWRRA